MDRTYRGDPATGSIMLIVMILGFVFFWPIGLAILLCMTCLGPRARWNTWGGNWNWQNNAWWSDHWYGENSMTEENQNGDRKSRRSHRRRHRHGCSNRGHRSRHGYHSSGNTAFDTYREDTLQRLEEEQGEFETFLDKLRQAKDKTEFDDFMTERKNRPGQDLDAPESDQPQA